MGEGLKQTVYTKQGDEMCNAHFVLWLSISARKNTKYVFRIFDFFWYKLFISDALQEKTGFFAKMANCVYF